MESLYSLLLRRIYAARIARAKRELIKGPGRASLPRLLPEKYHYRPVGKESLLAIQDNVRGQKSQICGRLIVTDKALIFESRDKNERITLTQIANVEFHVNGFTVMKRSGPPRLYLVSSPDAKFSAVLDLVLSRVE